MTGDVGPDCWFCDGDGDKHGATCPICDGDGVLSE